MTGKRERERDRGGVWIRATGRGEWCDFMTPEFCEIVNSQVAL